jgi:hypothetical protein
MCPASIDFIAYYVFNVLRKSARERSLREQLHLSNRLKSNILYCRSVVTPVFETVVHLHA